MCRSFQCRLFFFCLFFLFGLVLCFIFAFSIFMIIFNPQELKFSVTKASLARFDLTKNDNNTRLFYSLALNITIRNPNKKISVYFHRIEATTEYKKKRFSTVTFNSTTPFYQGHKNTTVLHTLFEGQQLVLLKEKEVKDYNSETSSGIYSIDVKIGVQVW
ncbi:hypothetical protein TIFTF001_008648 [Ficus carica]|uniref:Late embryogenesis abundant protein LEA-2 subgroup domain-containing protein n=1 Tax=Ficus carica TaxID=3494 RepID=A0AA87ZLT3_FICCA|nr:hypothetical protein TIFTF001_008648 [Ficus carica]